MPIAFQKKRAVLSDCVVVDDAEALLDWLQKNPKGRIDLADCQHLHTACLQVLMAGGARIDAWPTDPGLSLWLQSTLTLTH